MECSEPRLIAFLNGDLDPAAASEVDAHLLECDRCWRAVRDDRMGRTAAAQLRSPVPATLTDRLTLAIELPQEHRRRRARTRVAAGVSALGLVLLGSIATALYATSRDGHPSPDAVTQLVALSNRVPPADTTTQGGAVQMGSTVTTEIGGRPARVSYFASQGAVDVVATSSAGFVPPRDARPVTLDAMAWHLQRGGVTIYCPRQDVLIAGRAPLAVLMQLAGQLHLA